MTLPLCSPSCVLLTSRSRCGAGFSGFIESTPPRSGKSSASAVMLASQGPTTVTRETTLLFLREEPASLPGPRPSPAAICTKLAVTCAWWSASRALDESLYNSVETLAAQNALAKGAWLPSGAGLKPAEMQRSGLQAPFHGALLHSPVDLSPGDPPSAGFPPKTNHYRRAPSIAPSPICGIIYICVRHIRL